MIAPQTATCCRQGCDAAWEVFRNWSQNASRIKLDIPSALCLTSPRHGATVGQKVAVEGVLAGLRPEQHVFVCVKSQAFGRLIYPQGQVIPDGTGQWTVESMYATPGYKYETFSVVAVTFKKEKIMRYQHAREF